MEQHRCTGHSGVEFIQCCESDNNIMSYFLRIFRSVIPVFAQSRGTWGSQNNLYWRICKCWILVFSINNQRKQIKTEYLYFNFEKNANKTAQKISGFNQDTSKIYAISFCLVTGFNLELLNYRNANTLQGPSLMHNVHTDVPLLAI